MQLFGSSTSSSNKGSRSWMRGYYQPTHRYSVSDGPGLYMSSPSDTSLIQSWNPPPIQGINVDELENNKRDHVSGRFSFTQGDTLASASSTPLEGTSMMPDGRASISSHSDVSDYDHGAKLHLSAHRNFPSRRSFLAKPIHPLFFPMQTPTREVSEGTSAGFSEYDVNTPQRDTYRLSSGSSSIDLADIPGPFECEHVGRGYTPAEGFKCGLCERFLSQRSPWIMRSGEMPVTSVLSCRHVFHAECLDQATPKAHKNDPPCPICTRLEDENSPEQLHAFSKLRNSFPRLKPCADENSSRPWGCVQAGGCVEGALQAPHRSSMLLFNRDKLKKNLCAKGNPGKEFPGKLRKMSSHPLQLFSGKFHDHGSGGCSKTGAGPSVKK